MRWAERGEVAKSRIMFLGSEPNIRLPSLKAALGRQSPRACTEGPCYFPESQRAVGKRLHSEKAPQNSHTLGPRAEAVIRKQPESNPLTDLKEPFREEEATGTYLGTRTLAAATLGSSSYHEDVGAGNCF